MAKGYGGEQDLFVARACFEMLARGSEDKAEQLRGMFSGMHETPILNFTDMVIECIRADDKDLFVELVETYNPAIQRDPNFIEVSE